MDIRLGDYVRRQDQPFGPVSLVVDMPSPHDRRPQFQGKMMLFKGKDWVDVDDYVLADEAGTRLRRAIRDVLIRKDYEWPEDEREAYREHGWQPGVEAANAIRINKILDAFNEHREEQP